MEFEGEGIKKTYAYKSKVSKDKLEKYRKEFWGKIELETRIDGNPKIWELIYNSTKLDSKSAENLLAENQIKICQNMQICLDKSKFLYKIPCTVIHDPREFGIDEDFVAIPLQEKVEKLLVKLFS